MAFFQELKVWHRTADGVCVHGGLDPAGGAVKNQNREALIRGTRTFLSGYAGPETVLYGHWDNAVLNDEGWPAPAIRRDSIGVDTISHGVLTAIRLPDRHIFNQRDSQSRRHSRSWRWWLREAALLGQPFAEGVRCDTRNRGERA